LNIEEADLQPHLDHITEKGLVETLKRGIGYYHEAMDKQDKRIVERLFEAGAIQVLVASRVSISLSIVVNCCLTLRSRILPGVCQ
jgi:pre-mRNA-splicing helicase BRR2